MSTEKLRSNLSSKADGLRESTFKVLLNLFSNGSQTKYDIEKKSTKELKVCKVYVYQSIKILTDSGFIGKKTEGKTRAGQPRIVYGLTHQGLCVALQRCLANRSFKNQSNLTIGKTAKKFDCLVTAGKWAVLDPVILERIDYFVEKLGKEQAEEFFKCYSSSKKNTDVEQWREDTFASYFRDLKWCFDEATEEISDTEDFEEKYLKMKAKLSNDIEETKSVVKLEGMYGELMRDVEDQGLNIEKFWLGSLHEILNKIKPKWEEKYAGRPSEKFPKYDMSVYCKVFSNYLCSVLELRELEESKLALENWLKLLNSDSQLTLYANRYVKKSREKAHKELKWSEFLRKRIND